MLVESVSANCSAYHGFVTVRNCEYLVRLTRTAAPPAAPPPAAPSTAHHHHHHHHQQSRRAHPPPPPAWKMECDAELRALLHGHEDVVRARLAESPDPAAFVAELNDILERMYRVSPQLSGLEDDKYLAGMPSPSFYLHLVDELTSLWTSVESIDHTLTKLVLRLCDARGRVHRVQVGLPADYPDVAPNVRGALPVAVDIVWTRGAGLASIVQQFQKAFSRFQRLWDILDDLDAHAHILEPEHPSHAALTRRVALSNHCSLHMEIDPERADGVPAVLHLLGAERVVRPLRDRLHSPDLLAQWDCAKSLRLNLQQLLGVTFPPPPTLQEGRHDDASHECGICYCYRFQEALPDRVCEKCARPFHAACLAAWLRALPTARQSFDTIFGACPYCSHLISVSALAQDVSS